MDFPITTNSSLPAQSSQPSTVNPSSPVNVGNNALQSNPATTVNVAAQSGETGNDRERDRLGSQLDQAVSAQQALNDLQLTNRRTQINYNAELNRVFLEIVDVRTDEVVETIPPETLVRQLREQVEAPDTDDQVETGIRLGESV